MPPGRATPGPQLTWACSAPDCPGLTQGMVQLLRSHGIKTVVDFVSADLEVVAQKCGLSYKALVALRRVLLAQFSAFPFNGADLYEELKTYTAILSTGIESTRTQLELVRVFGEGCLVKAEAWGGDLLRALSADVRCESLRGR
nr:DNA repair protein RAD51 homolog 4-like [Camelus dromedarius]